MDSLSREGRIAWRGLRKELEGLGITTQALESNHDFIMDVFVRANETGSFVENPPHNAEGQAMLAIGPPEASREPSPTIEDREPQTLQIALPTPQKYINTESVIPPKEICKNTHPFRSGGWVGYKDCGDETCDAHIPMHLQHTLRLPAQTIAGPLPNAQYHRSSRRRYQHHHIYQLLKQKPRPNIDRGMLNQALMDACMYPSTGDMVWTFIQHGADPDVEMSMWIDEGEGGFMFGKVDGLQKTLTGCSAL